LRVVDFELYLIREEDKISTANSSHCLSLSPWTQFSFVTGFPKYFKLAYFRRVQQQKINTKIRRVGKPRKNGKMAWEGTPLRHVAHQLGKVNPVLENPGDNPWTRRRLDLDYEAIVTAACLLGLNMLSLFM